MKRVLLLAFLSVLLVTFSLYGQTDTVTILHVNDTHSNLATIGPRDASLKGSLGGVARAVSLLGMEKMADPKALFLHAGDVSIGDLFFTKYLAAAELQLLVAMGCDAMTVGNHEFDLTPAYLDTSLVHGFAGGAFPLLCANLYLEDPSVANLKQYIKPYTIKQVGSVKVGIFGLTTPETNLISQPAPAVFDTNFIQTAAAMVETLTTKGCNLVICLSHLGISYDQSVAKYVPGIHAIVGGHDHYPLGYPLLVQNPSGDTTLIVQANSFWLDMGKLRLTVGNGKVRLLDYSLIPITDAIPEEPTTKAAVDGMIADIESVYGPMFSAQVADVHSYFKEVADALALGQYETPIGKLVTDAFRELTHTEIAMEVGGSTAHPLYPGPIVAADVFRVVGYGYNTDNGLGYHLATFDISGTALGMGLEFGLSNIEFDDEFVVQASGMKYAFDPLQPPFSRLTGVVVGNEPLDPQRMYSVTANEFVPLFLSTMGIPFENLHVFSGDTTEFGALLSYVQGQMLVPTAIASPRPENAIPDKHELNQNYPNPFNPSTAIKYTVGGAGGRGSGVGVKLVVYDVLGRQVTVLVDEKKEPGNYEVVFNAAGLASGMYLYRLTAGGFSAVKKMMVVK